MGVRSVLALLSLISLTLSSGCNKDPQKVEPETRGKRGENCQARNDCEPGLACLNGICSLNEFEIGVAAKQCDRIECASTEHCCGDKPTEAPTRCNQRATLCTPTFTDCVPNRVCTSNDVCGDGTCRPAALGTCTGTAAGSCQTAADCHDVCTTDGTCALSGTACTPETESTDCFYYTYNATATCVTPTRTCNCTNPAYAPSDPICTDPDCVDLCLLRCEDERCVTDRSCDVHADCATFGLPLCEMGRCVACTKAADCDDDETCDEGVCHKPCKHNEECPLFNECNLDTGECEYVGCKSDRECVFSAGADLPESVPTPSGEDARLQKCLPSTADASIKTCKIPCENDGSCSARSVCDKGYCKDIGCESDEECRAYLGIANQKPTEARPFVPTAVCRD